MYKEVVVVCFKTVPVNPFRCPEKSTESTNLMIAAGILIGYNASRTRLRRDILYGL
jgi:hypothetical protein